jgi:xanthine dehydrogenase accessory factor
VARSRNAIERHEPAVMALALTPGAVAGRSLVVAADGEPTGTLGPELDRAVLANAASMLGTGAVSLLTVEGAAGDALVFVQAFAPPERLVICGGSHTAVVLADMAKRIGMHVTVVDARSAYLGRERFPTADGLVHAAGEGAGVLERGPSS